MNTMDTKTLAKCFLAGAKNLEANKEYINELYTRFFEQLEKDGIELTDVDKEYIDGMVNELEDYLKDAEHEETDSSEDEQQD